MLEINTDNKLSYASNTLLKQSELEYNSGALIENSGANFAHQYAQPSQLFATTTDNYAMGEQVYMNFLNGNIYWIIYFNWKISLIK